MEMIVTDASLEERESCLFSDQISVNCSLFHDLN